MNKSRCAAKYPSGVVLTKSVCFSKLSAVEIVKLDELKQFFHDFKGERLRFSRIIWLLCSFFTGLWLLFNRNITTFYHKDAKQSGAIFC
ncbi:hypothetical protein OB236_32520 [Paenibacillus sp. WQ 127069]|uniref:Uncharacterized protein n=1 Tax=Paenibacillus baimaensis TaxID=2982185 RepID=A0ABT2UQD2_9BACL|nr:hypothetical protein [Paenibacillus sp. WQ 127069]